MARRTTTSDLRESILDAMRSLLADRRFDEITVADVLAAAGVARGSFYFYFESKHDVLAELVRRAIGQGHDAAGSWISGSPDRATATRESIAAGARLWREQAPVLRAIVENWRSDPKLTEVWLAQMEGFRAATAAQLAADPAVSLAGVDPGGLAAALTWLGERAYYLAAIGVPPFDDEETLVDVLTHVWLATLYGERPA